MNESWDIVSIIALIISAGTLAFYIIELRFNLRRAKKLS